MRKSNVILTSVIATGLAAAISFGAVAAESGKSKADPMQFARGAKAWAKTCARCHNMKSAQDNSDEEWHVDVTHMRVRANIPGDMARDIIAFLKASN